MSEAEKFLVVLLVIYLLESTSLTGPAAVVLVNNIGRRWHTVLPHKFFGTDHNGLFLRPPLPPLGTTYLTYPWPVAASPTHVYPASYYDLFATPRAGVAAIALDEIRTVATSDRSVLLDERVFIRTHSDTMARRAAELIVSLKNESVERRATRLHSLLEDRFDVEAARTRIASYVGVTARLRILCNVLFFHLMVITPIAFYTHAAAIWWPWLLVGVLGLVAAIAVDYRRADRALYPERGSRVWAHLITMLVLPPAAIRAHDLLVRELLTDYDPLTIACALQARDDQTEQAKRVWRESAYPVPATATIPAWEADWSRTAFKEALQGFLSTVGFDSETLEAPPVPDAECKSYCPRCHCQFVVSEGTCRDCGVALRQLG